MTLGFAILYVPDVLATVEFYERALGMKRRLVADGNIYAELDGAAPLAVCQESFAAKSAGVDIALNRPDRAAGGFELGFVTADVDAAYAHAVASGATAAAAPVDKPWGQRVAYVRDPNGVLVELCTAWSPSAPAAAN